jgi:hypothetical protein
MSPWAIAQNPFERLLKLNQNKRKEKEKKIWKKKSPSSSCVESIQQSNNTSGSVKRIVLGNFSGRFVKKDGETISQRKVGKTN